jgi:phosphatidylglycerophosphatase A
MEHSLGQTPGAREPVAASTWAMAVATVLGAGRSPVAPGTVGALCALPLALGMTYAPLWAQLGLAVLVTVVGAWAAGQVCRAKGLEDPQVVVVDEFAGILVTFLGVTVTWTTAILGFALFRIFDIAKPYPVKWLESNVRGGAGVMLDDVGAGLLACLVLQLWVRLL